MVLVLDTGLLPQAVKVRSVEEVVTPVVPCARIKGTATARIAKGCMEKCMVAESVWYFHVTANERLEV